MEILYIANVFDEETGKKYFDKRLPPIAASNYHNLLSMGLAQNGVHVNILSVLPATKNNSSKKRIKKSMYINGNRTIKYIPYYNIPILKNLQIFIYTFFYVLFRKDADFLIIDGLVVSSGIGAYLAGKITKKRVLGVVTDFPEFLPISKSKIMLKINEWLIRSFSRYLFLNINMASKLGVEKGSFILIDGQVKLNDNHFEVNLDLEQKILLYTGSINKKYGIDILCNSFINAHVDNYELHLYGNGDYEKELKNICEINKNIKFFGMVNNETALLRQREATILINPRQPNEEFSKYSFPSKNLEYMMSGRPVINFLLSGMDEDYGEYTYIIPNGQINDF